MNEDWKPRYGLVPKPDFNFEMDFMQLMQDNEWPNTGYQEPETETGTDYEIYSCGDAGTFAWAYDRYFELDYLHVDGTDELWEYALSTFSVYTQDEILAAVRSEPDFESKLRWLPEIALAFASRPEQELAEILIEFSRSTDPARRTAFLYMTNYLPWKVLRARINELQQDLDANVAHQATTMLKAHDSFGWVS